MSKVNVPKSAGSVKAQPTDQLRPVATVKFRSPSLVPDSCLAAYDETPVDDIRISAAETALPRPTSTDHRKLTCGDVYEWMFEHCLKIKPPYSCRTTYNRGRWVGLYTLTLAKEVR